MNKLLRFIKHRWLDERDTQRLLGADGLRRLQARVQASESRHSGEIRLCIEPGLPLSYLWAGASARERALAMFGKLRVWDTEANNGVLIYLLLAEQRIEIVADRGLNRYVGAARWHAIMETMRGAFREGHFEAGLNDAITAVDALLVEHFALDAAQVNPNELPDAPYLR